MSDSDMRISGTLHVNEGEGKYSYYRNSLLQKDVILKVKPVLEKSIAELCRTNLSAECLKIAEMGCSSGPNALLPLWEMIQTIDSTCKELNKKSPVLQVFLNDLPGTDFNTIFRSLLPGFYDKLNKEKGSHFGPCFISAVPGSFYGRLFPSRSLHFVHSSSSLHWCSQVPAGLITENGIPLNKGNICISEKSPPSVHLAYLNQFEKDFTSFLISRSEEMITGGTIVLTFLSRSDTNPHSRYGNEIVQLVGISLMDMVNEGLIEESMLDSFNLQVYTPSAKEVEYLIQKEGSFTIKHVVEDLEVRWDGNIDDGNKEAVFDKWERGKHVATYVRAVLESILSSHFGVSIIDNLFSRLSLKAADCLEKGIGSFSFLVISNSRNNN